MSIHVLSKLKSEDAATKIREIAMEQIVKFDIPLIVIQAKKREIKIVLEDIFPEDKPSEESDIAEAQSRVHFYNVVPREYRVPLRLDGRSSPEEENIEKIISEIISSIFPTSIKNSNEIGE